MQVPLPVLPHQPHQPKKVAPSKSKASTSASRRAARLLKAKEELLQLRVELAAAKIAAIEAESDSDEDIDTIMADPEQEERVDNWLDNSRCHMLAISDEPHIKPAASSPPESQPIIESTVAPVPAGETTSATASANKVDLTELATAIAQAAKSSQHSSRIFNELPYFGGCHHEWLSFKAAYCESEGSFSDIENLAHLRRSLKGKAREAVESLLIYSSNPRNIMKTLEARFGRPDAIAISEIDRIRSLPRLTDSLRDLCIFPSKVSNIVATLEAINKKQYLFNPEITKSTIEKLTPTLRYRWYDFAVGQSTDEPEIAKLARFLNREADI